MTRRKKKEIETAAPTKDQSLTGRYLVGQFVGFLRHHTTTLCWLIFGVVASGHWSETLRAFAGKETFANLNLGILADFRFAWSVAIAASGLGVWRWRRERKEHQETRERLTKRTTELELAIDPGRSSSKLTSKGTTRKGD